jgi:CRP-like cAMP-binding protein
VAVDFHSLREVRFLAPLKDRELKRLAGEMNERTAHPGEDIVTQGSSGVAFFIVLEGTASVLVDGVERAKLGPGDHFGEIALVVPGAARTATVRADTEVRVGAMAEWNFKAFVTHHPEVTWPLLVTLAEQAVASASS